MPKESASSAAEPKGNLAEKGIAAVFWGSFGSVARTLLQIVTQIILARILGPVEYGIFAIGAIVLGFSNFFADFGISYGLIQKKTVSEDDILYVFTWQLIIGSIVGVVVFFLAEPLAVFFSEPRVVPVIRALAVICLLNALSSLSVNLLKRQIDFKPVQITQITSYIVGYVLVGIPMAWMGMKVWSLIAAFVVREIVITAMLYRYTLHPIGIRIRKGEDNDLMSYGLKVLATNFVNWMIGNVDRIMVGRLFSPAQVGLYSVSYNLVYSPAGTVINVIQSALFSASSRAQDDIERLRRAFLTMAGTMTVFAFPLFIGMGVVSETILHSLYGSEWVAAAEMLGPITFAMPVYVLLGIATPMLWVSGQTHKEFVLQIPIVIGFTVATWLASRHSLTAVAWVVFGMYAVRSGTILIATCRALGIAFMPVARAMSGGIVLAFFTAAGIALTDHAARMVTSVPIVWLLADVAAGAISSLTVVWFWPRLVDAHTYQLFEKVAARLPAMPAWCIQKLIGRAQVVRSS